MTRPCDVCWKPIECDDHAGESGLYLCGQCLVAYRKDQFNPTPDGNAWAHIHPDPYQRLKTVAERLRIAAERAWPQVRNRVEEG